MKALSLLSLAAIVTTLACEAQSTTQAGGIRWTHNGSSNTNYSPDNWYGDDIFSSISDEGFEDPTAAYIQSSSLIVDAPNVGYIEYSFTTDFWANTETAQLNYFAFPSTTDILTVADPDTNSKFVSHSYDGELFISTNGFATSESLGIFDDINQYTTTRLEQRVTLATPYALSDNTTYTMRVVLTDLNAGDAHVLYDDFFFQYAHTTTTIVPEPSSALLLSLSAIGLFTRRRR